MDQLSTSFAQPPARGVDRRPRSPRGFTLTLLLLLGAAWLVSLAPLVYIAHRISRPIQQLTEGLTDFATATGRGGWRPAGRRARLRAMKSASAVDAFNRMADQLRQSRERLVHLTQIASWQSLARKTAHEVKNSLTPIRLTVEEMQARLQPPIAPSSIRPSRSSSAKSTALERRVRAFSDFSSEPPVNPEVLDVNALVSERVSLLRPAHPDTTYHLSWIPRPARSRGRGPGEGILTNLLKNAAEAAGRRLGPGVHRPSNGLVSIEVHDSGPGLSQDAAATLFEPTITFKEHGMGLGSRSRSATRCCPAATSSSWRASSAAPRSGDLPAFARSRSGAAS
jgi:nitrogen fixation/metabolism regulation signal transduction histidine kinase